VKLICLFALSLAAVAQSAEAIRKQLASVAIQREAIRQQAGTAAKFRLAGNHEPAFEAPCEPIAEPELTPIIDAAAQSNQVQPQLIRSVIEQESGARPCAISEKGAQGLMQLMPATIDQFHVENPLDAKQNVEAGVQFLKQLLEKYKGDLGLVLAAFNAGPATVDQAGGIPDIQETKDYVDSVLKKMRPKD
jgi:soluble lytic murein transglycosylase-like protein